MCGENEKIFFKVSGTHTVYLTGNYVMPMDEPEDHMYDSEEDEEDYDLTPEDDELDIEGDEDESDELDDLEDPRVTEVDSDEELADAPKLIETTKVITVEKPVKGKGKRPAEDSESEEETATLDDLIAKSIKPAEPVVNGEAKLSKKQKKKLKKLNGEAATAPSAVPAKEEASAAATSAKPDKKVQFAKNLEQGPTKPSKKEPEAKTDVQKPKEQGKTTLGVKMVKEVSVDDRKLGEGPPAKKGDKLRMRYIGKLEDGKVFDGMITASPEAL